MPLILPTATVPPIHPVIFRSKMASRCLQDAFKMQSFFHSFFNIVFVDFYPNLDPTWPQLGPQIHPKTHPRAVKNRSQIASYFWSVFWLIFSSIFHRFSMPKSTKNLSKINPKIIPRAQLPKYQKSIKNVKLSTILAISAMPCWGENSINIRPKSITKQLSNQHPNLHRFWSQLGFIFGWVWGPSSVQIASKIDLQIHQKIDHISDRSWDRFWSILGPNLAPKSAPKPTQEPSKIDPKSHLIFDQVFDWFLIDFWLIFGSKINPQSKKKIDHKIIPTTQQPKSEKY